MHSMQLFLGEKGSHLSMPPVENNSLEETPNRSQSNTILFNATKNELFRLNDNYKTLQRKLKSNWKINATRDDQNGITQDLLANIRVFVLAGSREKFTGN